MKFQTNLIHSIPKKVTQKFSANQTTLIWGIFVAILLLVYAFSYAHKLTMSYQISNLKKKQQAAAANVIKIRAENPGISKDSVLEDTVLALSEAISSKQNMVNFLSSQGKENALGFVNYLEALAKYTPPRIWLTEIYISDGGQHIQLKGKTVSPNELPPFISTLEKHPPFSGKNFKIFNLSEPSAESLKKDKDDNAYTFVLETGPQTDEDDKPSDE